MIRQCAKSILASDFLIINSGAGMGVDSGLPDFRGLQGFWNVYPYFKDYGMSLSDAASPYFLHKDPESYWCFYGHRFNMYRNTKPNSSFEKLLDISHRLKKGNYFVFTSNVDGHFQKAGFNKEKVYEVHGSINYSQCNHCSKIEPMPEKDIPIDMKTFKCLDIPKCKHCGSILRPNILMFSDYEFSGTRVDEQNSNYSEFIRENT